MNEREISDTRDANDRGRELAWGEGNDEADRSVMRALQRNRDRMPIDHTGVRRNVLGALASGGASAGGLGKGTGFAGGATMKIVASIAGLVLLAGGLFVLVDTSGPEGAASPNRGSIPTMEQAAPDDSSMPSTQPAQDVGSIQSSAATPSATTKNDVQRGLPNTSSAREITVESVPPPVPDVEKDQQEPAKQPDQPPVYKEDGANIDLEINTPSVSRRKP